MKTKRLKYQMCRDGFHDRCPGKAPERDLRHFGEQVVLRASSCTCWCHKATP